MGAMKMTPWVRRDEVRIYFASTVAKEEERIVVGHGTASLENSILEP